MTPGGQRPGLPVALAMGLTTSITLLAACRADSRPGASDLLRACAVASTCDVGPAVSSCVEMLGQALLDPLQAGAGAHVARPPLADQVACLAAASPTAATACRVLERCQRGSTGTACGAAPPGCGDGEAAQGCDERGELTRVECAHVGLTCVEFPGGVDCGVASCQTDERVASCQGDRAVQCQEGVLTLAFDCGARGLRCAVLPTVGGTCGSSSALCSSDTPCVSTCDKGLCRFAAQRCQDDGDCAVVKVPCVLDDRAACQGDGPACQTGQSPPRCEGDDRVTCEGGREHRTACSVIPGHVCRQGSCVPDEGCQAATHRDRCDGDQLVVCQAGQQVRRTCRELGLGRCAGGRCTAP